MQSEDLTIHDKESITFVITADGRVVFPWWNPLTDTISKNLGELVGEESSNFCG